MKTFTTGQRVRVLEPFAASFHAEQVIAPAPPMPEGHDEATDGPWPPEGCYWLEGVEVAFSGLYLEAAA